MATKAENFAKQQEMLKNAGVDINKYNAAIAGGASTADALKAGGYTGTTTNTGNTKTNTSTQTSSGLNAVSQSSLDANKNKAQVGTGAVAGFNNTQQKTQELTNRVNQVNQDIEDTKTQLAKRWNLLDYDTQQKELNTINGLKEGLASKGITSKTQPTTQTTTTTPAKTNTTTKQTTPQQDRWDYQDNSQARMDQIADNLDKYRQTQPGLFEDASAFYNFFIDGKGRSQDQIDYLWDYFNRVQKFGKYDNLPASTIGDMLANGKLGDDYLNYLKTTDPAKYQEALSYRQDAEDTIKYESFLSDTADQAGLSGFEKFYKGIFGYRDENDDKIDDSLYIAPTEEEQTKQNRVNTIDSRVMEIKNMQKNLLDDLVEQYPGVPKATLMGIVQDRTKDLQREYDDLMVERTGLVGNIEYMQNERDMQSKARQSTINNLEKAYGMYYDYSPQGMAERVQAQYAATNITLDQADSGNETQKQMALQNVLDGYYDKYGDIIQRSEQQVINDVIAYAKKNGIGLAQALQENFVKPLQSKPEFATLSSGRSITAGGTDKWSVETIKDANGNDLSVMINQATGETRLMNGNAYTGGTSGTTSYGKSYNVVSPTELVDGLSNFVSGYEIGDKGGQCGAFVNNGLKSMGVADSNIYDNSKESKLGSKNEDANASAQTGWVAIWKPEVLTGDGAKYGHVGFVVQDNGDGTVKVLDSNGTKNPQTGKYDETVGVRDVPKSSLYGYFNPSQGTGTAGGADDGEGDLFSAKVLSWIPTQLRNTDVEKKWYLDIAEKQRAKGLSSFETAMSIMGFDITNNSPLAQNTKQKILDATMAQGDEIVFNSAVLSSMAQSINKGDYEKALLTLENQLGSFMSKSDGGDLSRSTVSQGIKAIDELNKVKNYKGYAGGAWNTVADLIGAEGKNTATFNVWTNNVSRALRGLGYEKEEIEDMIPKLTNDKATFNNRMAAIEEALLGQYNTIRRNHNLPSMTKEALLGNQSLYDIYRVWNTEQLRSQLQNAQNRNINLRYGQPTTITAEAIKII